MSESIRETTEIPTVTLSQALTGALAGTGEHGSPRGFLVSVADAASSRATLAAIEEEARNVDGSVLRGAWREGLARPFGALIGPLGELVERMLTEDPQLVWRYRRTLGRVLRRWRDDARFREVTGLGERSPEERARAGLPDLALRGNKGVLHHFFQKRDEAPQVVGDLVYFILGGVAALSRSSRGPVFFYLEGGGRADELTASTIQLLVRYARVWDRPFHAVVTGTDLTSELERSFLGAEPSPAEWLRVEPLPAGDESAARLSDEARSAVEALAVLAAPASQEDIARIGALEAADRIREALDEARRAGVVRSAARERFDLSAEHWREQALGALSDEQLLELHRRALEADESSEAALGAFHAERVDPELFHRLSLEAMEWAWAVSGYESALHHAENALRSVPEGKEIDRELLLAFLHYEGGAYAEAEKCFRQALDQRGPRPSGVDRGLLRYFLGYNAVFGLHEYDRGRKILEDVLVRYEKEGAKREREIGYVRNSIAFAMYRSGHLTEAIDVEEMTLDLLEKARQSDSFLVSILNLNLGRLYRNVGVPDQAYELFREGMYSSSSELSPYAQLLFHSCLAHLQFGRRELKSAFVSQAHCHDLVRDLMLDGLREQVLFSLPPKMRRIPLDRALRGDIARYYLTCNQARVCHCLGLEDRVESYLQAIEGQEALLGPEAVRAARDFVLGPVPEMAEDAGWTHRSFAGAAEKALASHGQPLASVATGAGVRSAVIDVLSAGQAVAWVRPREVAPGISQIDSVVLCDPRHEPLAAWLNKEVGGGFSPRASAAFVHPQELSLFRAESVQDRPLVHQYATLEPEARLRFPGLEPIDVTAQVLKPDLDGELYELLAEYRERTGVGVLAVIPFHLRMQALAVDPAKALQSFLVSSIRSIVLGDQLYEKAYGATAKENLLALHPRVSRRAVLFDSKADADTFVVRILHTWGGGFAPSEFLQLNNKTRPILDLCTGDLNVAELCQRLTGHSEGKTEENVSQFLRQLWRHGVVLFSAEEPREKAA